MEEKLSELSELCELREIKPEVPIQAGEKNYALKER